jgi:hypothetical protein
MLASQIERGNENENEKKFPFFVCFTGPFSDEDCRRHGSPPREFLTPLRSHHYGLQL